MPWGSGANGQKTQMSCGSQEVDTQPHDPESSSTFTFSVELVLVLLQQQNRKQKAASQRSSGYNRYSTSQSDRVPLSRGRRRFEYRPEQPNPLREEEAAGCHGNEVASIRKVE
ncbi:hypothetical protein GN956_G7236 [Arapaima gigas]